jgi:hypothetical protein
MLPSIQKCLFIMSLEVSPCFLFIDVTCVSVVFQFVVDESFFSLSIFSLSSIENYNLVLLVVNILTSILILLISNF